jgi:hypothetical protein
MGDNVDSNHHKNNSKKAHILNVQMDVTVNICSGQMMRDLDSSDS